jgi:maleate isomerase
LASVYHHDVTEAFIDFLAAAGIATVQHASLDAPSDRALAACRPGQIFDIAQAADTTDAEMMLIPETALHTTALLAELEARLRKPVLTATQVTVWHSLSLLGRAYSHRDLGALFRP